MTPKKALWTLAWTLCALTSTWAVAQQSPNIVFILADDLGIGDTGITNQNARAALGLPAIATPNIDSIALSGARYNNMYAGASNCSPSRAVLLTGFHQRHTLWEQGLLEPDIRPGNEDFTWGQTLQQAGYSTGMFGKWHLGGVNNNASGIRTPSALPTQKGFETAYGPMVREYRMAYHWESDGTGGMRKFFTPPEPTWTGAGDKNTFGDILVAQRAVDFIRTSANGAKPFAAYIPFMAPHDPISEVPKDHPYANMPWPQPERDYAGLIWYLDQHVGQILNAIDDPNNDGNKSDSVANNTIVIFTSDNGPVIFGTFNGFDPAFFNSNGSYYGYKNMSTEGGIKEPFFIRWPGVIAPNSQSNVLATFADILPTFAELTGQDVPLGIDGQSMLSDWKGTGPSDRPDSLSWTMSREIGGGNPAGSTIRIGDWKFTKNQPTGLIPNISYRLFNVATDPGETINRASDPALKAMVTAMEQVMIAEGAEREPYAPVPDNANIIGRVNTYFTQYKSWAPQAGSNDFFSAGNWAGGTPYDFPGEPEANNWNTGPADNWLATMANTTAGAKSVSLTADANVLALGLAGNTAEMRLVVPAGRKLTTRNGTRISAGGVLQVHDGEVNTIRTLEIRPGGKLEMQGTITGQQQVVANVPEFAAMRLFEPTVVNSGELNVGDGAAGGILNILGKYQQGSSGKLHFDLFASTGGPGAAFDRLTVQREVTLNGLLDVAVAPGSWQPKLGDAFEILSSTGGITGTFSTATMPPLASGWGWNILYTPNAVSLQVVEQTLASLIVAPGQPLGASVSIVAGQTIDLTGNLRIGQNTTHGDLTIGTGGFVRAAGTTTIDAGGVLTLAGGTLKTGLVINTAGGTFAWQSGTLNFTGNLRVIAGQSLGANVAVGDGQTLDVDGQLNIDAGTVAVNAGALASADAGVMIASGSTLTLAGGTLATSTLTTAAGGSFAWNSGTLRFTGDLAVAPNQSLGASAAVGNGQNLEVANNLAVGQGTDAGGLTINVGGQVAVTNQTKIGSAGALTLAGGKLSTATLQNTSGGAFNWQSGTLRFTGDLNVAAGGDLGTNVNLASGRTLEIANRLNVSGGSLTVGPDGQVAADNATTIGNGGSITLSGGKLSTASLQTLAGGTLNWTSGTLRFTNDLNVAAGGDLGSSVTIGAARTLEVGRKLNIAAGTVTVDPQGVVSVADATTINAGGTLLLVGGTFTTKSLQADPGGPFVWQSGMLNFTDDFTISAGQMMDALSLGNDQSLAANNLAVGDGDLAGALAINIDSAVQVAGETIIDSGGVLTIQGGSLTTGSLLKAPVGSLRFIAGSLSITGADGLTIDSTGPLGKSASVAPGQSLSVAGTTSVEAGAALNVLGGQFSTGMLALNGGTYNAMDLQGVGGIAFTAGVIKLAGAQALTGDGPLGPEVAVSSDQTIEIGGPLTVGNADHPIMISIDAGGLMSVGAGTTIGNGSVLLLNGGTFSTASVVGEAGATFGWNTGTLQVRSDFSVSPAGSLGGALAVVSDQKLDVIGQLDVTDGSLTVGAGGVLNIQDPTSVAATGAIHLNGGTFATSALSVAPGGAFDWQSGTVQLAGNQDVAADSSVSRAMGGQFVIGSGRHLSIGGTATLYAPLLISGGTLSVGQLVNGSLLDFSSGTLNLTGGDLLIGEVGTFGSTFNLHPTATLNVTHTTTVATGALLAVSDNAVMTAQSIANNGEIQLGGPTATVSAGVQLSNLGVIRGQGRVTGGVTNEASGSVIVDVGQRVNFLGPTFTNGGHVTVTGAANNPAEIVFDGAVTNAAGSGLITAASGRLRFNAGAANAGSLTITGGDNHIYGNIENTGQILVTGGSMATFYGDVVQNGVLQVSNAGSSKSVAVFLGNVTGLGGSMGDGDIFFEGSVRPGSSPAQVTYANNVFFDSSSNLQIELGGITPGVDYDKIVVSGTLTLGGALDVELVNGFVPVGGQSFTVASAGGGISGAFATTSLPSLPGLTWQVNLTSSELVLKLIGPATSADFDGNGRVDGGDFLRWQRNLGRVNATLADGDANGDGHVDGADLSLWRSAFGGTSATVAVQGVPEPSAWQLAAMVVTGLIAAGSRHGVAAKRRRRWIS